MDLHIGGNWWLSSDPLNLILVEKYISQKKGKSFGKEQTAERGYYRTIELVLNAVLDKEIMRSDAESLTDLKNDVANARKLIEAFCNERELGFNDLRRENEELRLEIKRLQRAK